MTHTFPSVRSYLYAALCPLIALSIACGSKKSEPVAEDFPPSVTADKKGDKTATLPARPPVPIAEPMAPLPSKQVAIERVMPTTYKGFLSEGKQALADGDGADALAMFTKAAESKPYAYPRIQMARALLSMDMFETARTHAETAVDMDEKSTFAWNTLGRVELAAGDLEAAVASFEHAVEADEHNSYAWNNLGFTLLRQERYEEATEALESATSGASPKDFMWNNLAMAYEHLDMISEARASYRQAVELGSEKAEASLIRLHGVVSLRPSGIEVPTEPNIESGSEEPLIVPSTEALKGAEGANGANGDGEQDDQNDAITPASTEASDDSDFDDHDIGC